MELAREREQAAKRDEVFAVKPTLWGVGVDLKVGWRKLKARWRGRAMIDQPQLTDKEEAKWRAEFEKLGRETVRIARFSRGKETHRCL